MKRFLLAFLFLILATKSAEAHGGAPFTIVNGERTVTNPVFSAGPLLQIANETAPRLAIVNREVNFDLDRNLIPIDPAQLPQVTFYWNFGDGTKAEGLTVTHRYAKTGSFYISLKVTDPATPDPVEIESIKIHVADREDYQLPEAVISVDGKVKGSNFAESPVFVKGSGLLRLDGKSSKGKIKTYEWDFNDGSKVVKAPGVKHNFVFSSEYTFALFPILRVTDEKGFSAENLVEITNEDAADVASGSAKELKSPSNWLIYVVVGIGVVLAMGGVVALWMLRRRGAGPGIERAARRRSTKETQAGRAKSARAR